MTEEFGADFFGAGGMLNLTEPVGGDAFLAGGHVSVASEIQGDLVAAGGEVSIGGNVGDDVYAAGGNVKLDAIVAGNARIGGGEVAIGPATAVSGAVSVTGGRVDFEGDAHDYLQASGGSVRINGVVHGDARVRAQDVVIGPDTQIGGRLIVYGPAEPEVPDGAVVAGGVEFHATSPEEIFDGGRDEVRQVAHGFGSVIWYAGLFVAGGLFLLVFPELSARASATIGREPLRSLGTGFAVLVVVPACAVLLLFTIIGIPLALLLVPLYLVLLFLGWVTAALFIGQKAIGAVRSAPPTGIGPRLAALLIAFVLLWLLGHVPYVGSWVKFGVLLAGMGALVVQAWSGRGGVLRGAL